MPSSLLIKISHTFSLTFVSKLYPLFTPPRCTCPQVSQASRFTEESPCDDKQTQNENQPCSFLEPAGALRLCNNVPRRYLSCLCFRDRLGTVPPAKDASARENGSRHKYAGSNKDTDQNGPVLGLCGTRHHRGRDNSLRGTCQRRSCPCVSAQKHCGVAFNAHCRNLTDESGYHF